MPYASADPPRGEDRWEGSVPGPQSGFTLLEALVALLLAGLGVVGALEAASRTLRTQADVGRYAEAAQLADERLRGLSLLPRDSLSSCCDARWRVLEVGDRRYRRRSDVAGAEGGPDLWRAFTEVAWQDGSVRLETLLYRPERAARAERSP